MAGPTAFLNPNLYQLQGGGIFASYATNGIDGKPHFSFQDAQGSQSFTGAQIDVAETSIGQVVTVIIRHTVDSGSTSFSLLIPTVNLTAVGQQAQIQTDGITTVHRFSVLRAADRGQIELYQFTPMSGTAEKVEF
jgi:hypothetical protein